MVRDYVTLWYVIVGLRLSKFQVNPDQIKIDFSSASILVIVIGVLIILFVFCGCCGACLSAGWMLIW